jgi:hypothetical protein
MGLAVLRGGLFKEHHMEAPTKMSPLLAALCQQAPQTALAVDNYTPELGTPMTQWDGAAQAVEQQQYDLNMAKLRVHANDIPFTKKQTQNIIQNLAMSEALTANKATDRLAALTLVGKGTQTDYFTAEKREVTLTTTALKESIESRLTALFAEEILEGEFEDVSVDE